MNSYVFLYINKEKSKEELATQVFRNDNLRKKYTEFLHVYELLSVVGIETFGLIYLIVRIILKDLLLRLMRP